MPELEDYHKVNFSIQESGSQRSLNRSNNQMAKNRLKIPIWKQAASCAVAAPVDYSTVSILRSLIQRSNYRVQMKLSHTNFLIASTLMFILLFSVTAITNAQQTEENEGDLKHLQEQLQKEYFSFGMLIESVADYQSERAIGNNGFNISTARIKVYGELDQRFGYNLQASLLNNPTVLDADIHYKLSSDMSAKVGLFKSPFSYEYLTGAASTDFINRSTAVNQLAPKRQIGFQINGTTSNKVLNYTAGIFNGNNFGNNQNNDNQFLYVGRLETNLSNESKTNNEITLGVNASYEQNKQPAASGNLVSTFEGEQTLIGSDIRITQNNLLLGGEIIYSWLKTNTSQTYHPYGYHLTAGYFLGPITQLLLRWNNFKGDSLAIDSESLVTGVNISPSAFSEIQLNYIIPTEQAIEYSQVLLNLQLSF